jgi:drug/metabolite transporter (DMT)-like permease
MLARPERRAEGERAALAAAGLALLGVTLYGTGPVLIKHSTLTGDLFVFWRILLSVPLFTAPYLLGRATSSARRPPAAVWLWPALAGLAFAAHQMSFVFALRATSVTTVSLIGALQPMVTAAGARLLLAEALASRTWLAATLAVVGSVVVAGAGSSGLRLHALGVALAFANVALISLFYIVLKVGHRHLDVLRLQLGAMIAAAAIVGVAELIAGRPVGSVTSADLLGVVAVVLVPGGAGMLATVWALRWMDTSVHAVLQLGVPPVAIGLAWLALGERPSPLELVGGAIVLAGVGVVLWRQLGLGTRLAVRTA